MSVGLERTELPVRLRWHRRPDRLAADLSEGAGFDRAVLAFSHSYARQKESDCQALCVAVKPARLAAAGV